MKIAVIIGCDIFTPYNYGGKLCATSHCDILRRLFGEKSLRIFTFTEFAPPAAAIPADTCVYPAAHGKAQALMLALQNRKVISSATEKRLLADVRRFDPDVIWFEGSVLGRLAGLFPDIPKLTFLQNIEQLYAKNKVVHQGPVYFPSYTASRYNETLAVKNSQLILCLNHRDADALKALYGRSADALLPIALADTFTPAAAPGNLFEPNTLLFVGSNFPPNAQGITWFVRQVMPRLPGWRLQIVGKGMEALRPQLAVPGIEVIGGVDDLSPYYQRAAAMVLPILYGDGMKVKTAEAMMYGKRIFASPEALTGYEADGVSAITLCRDADEFISAITEYAAVQQGFFAEVRGLYTEKYALNTQGETLRQLLLRLTKKPTAEDNCNGKA